MSSDTDVPEDTSVERGPVDVEDHPLVSDEDRFEASGILGRGGMGEVRLYRDRRISRFVAYKVLRKAVENDPNYRSRFLLEARVQGQLEHPSIVPVHDLGETEDGELYFSMKSVRGVTLKQAIDSIKRGDAPTYTRRRLLSAFASVCQAVDFAHTRGVVHRDLKPPNVMLGDYGEVYVLDWGIAKVMHRTETPLTERVEVPGGSTNTRAGLMLGTPKYMAPERKHDIANPQTDVYALGMILGEILEAHVLQGIDPELEAIQLRAIALSPGDRYPTARALHDDLEHYLDGRRDLEMRKQLAEEHARRAKEALDRADQDPQTRSLAGQEIGRALGLDPQNRAALRTLMGMLTNVPRELPPAAVADMEQRWRERRQRTMRVSTISTAAMLLLVPMFLWMGVRDWLLLGLYIGLGTAAAVVQFFGGASRFGFGLSLMLLLATITMLTTSFGLLGVVPAAFAIVALAWRMNVTQTIDGVLIVLAAGLWLIAPFVLVELGLIEPSYVVRDGALVVLPKMHAFPPTATLVSLVLATFGAISTAVLYGRLYVQALRRAEHKLSFQAWQLQQLIPPER
ncbi:MAG TPA: serine/threonine-protein kinase [Kofleriaceae bacterium]